MITMVARILKVDRYQKGEKVIACRYKSAREAIKGLHEDLFSK